MLIHIILLHGFSSSNPSINNNSLIISSYPVIFKDSYSSLIAVSILSPVILYFEPDTLGNSDNQIIANPPLNIIPLKHSLLET